MGRVVKDWKAIKADEMQVAPHRYLWSGDNGPTGLEESVTEFKAKVPYKEGEVIWVERGGQAVKALIYRVLVDRDRFGDRQELYRVQVETANGTFSKLWENVWPGFVQRGYLKAGWAPDLEGKL